MITIKSIADERLDFALECVQTVIEKTECYLSPEEQAYNPTERAGLKKSKYKEVSKNDQQFLEISKNYHQYVKSFGMLMLNSGLVAALLFAQGKANKGDDKAKAYELIILHLTCWLKQREFIAEYNQRAIVELFNKNGSDIRTITREVLSFLEDLKRVADARFYKPE